MRGNKKDDNHNDLTRYWEALGAIVIDTSGLKEAFDCIVIHKGRGYFVEIKNPLNKKIKGKIKDFMPESKLLPLLGAYLSKGERKCKKQIENAGGTYYIITSPNEAKSMLDGWVREK